MQTIINPSEFMFMNIYDAIEKARKNDIQYSTFHLDEFDNQKHDFYLSTSGFKTNNLIFLCKNNNVISCYENLD